MTCPKESLHERAQRASRRHSHAGSRVSFLHFYGGARVSAPLIEYEFWDLSIPRTQSRNAVCRMLTAAAEYQGWELDRLRKDSTGARTVRLRRKIIRMRSTLV